MTLRNVLPGWSVRLMVLCLLIPALLAALDAFFRARRHHLHVGAWVGWALAAGAAVPLAWAWLRILGIAGALPAPRGPVLPSDLALTSSQAAALASVALALAAGAARRAAADAAVGAGARRTPAAGAAGAAVGAVVCGVALLVWISNPYAAALLLPAAHVWLFLGAPQTRLRGARGWVGARWPACSRLRSCSSAEMDALRIGPLGLARLWLVATAGGHVSAWSALALGALVGAVATLVRVLLARRRIGPEAPPEHEPPRTRGPATYAGPGLARRHGVGPAPLMATGAPPRVARRDSPGRAGGGAPAARRRALRVLSTLLIVAGALVLADGLVTLVWQEPVTALYARVQQDRLDDELAALERTEPAPDERRALAQLPDPAPAPRASPRARSHGARPGRPARAGCAPRRSGSSTVVVEGTGGDELRSGPGHYPDTAAARPARDGRDRRPPHDIRRAVPAPRRPGARRPRSSWRCRTAASPTGSSGPASSRRPPSEVVDRVAYDRLVLTACHPLYSASQRIVVFARLESARPEFR